MEIEQGLEEFFRLYEDFLKGTTGIVNPVLSLPLRDLEAKISSEDFKGKLERNMKIFLASVKKLPLPQGIKIIQSSESKKEILGHLYPDIFIGGLDFGHFQVSLDDVNSEISRKSLSEITHANKPIKLDTLKERPHIVFKYPLKGLEWSCIESPIKKYAQHIFYRNSSDYGSIECSALNLLGGYFLSKTPSKEEKNSPIIGVGLTKLSKQYNDLSIMFATIPLKYERRGEFDAYIYHIVSQVPKLIPHT